MIKDLLNLSGKNALVTGSSQGIGAAIALGLAEFGANVLIHYHANSDKAEAVADQVRALDVKSDSIQADLSEPDAADKLFRAAVDAFGTIDILVLNASVQLPKLWAEATPDEFDEQVTANWKANLQLMQLSTPAMVERGWGRVLTIGSVQEEKPHPTMVVYAGTKAAMANTVKNLALQLASKGVTINNLSPGVIDTARTGEPTPPVDEAISQRMTIPLEDEGDPVDCAPMALLLCSEAGRYITGQTIFVDGGMSL
ncbi:SDR family NAD(P)-dependent oxidoreductase [Spirosoma rhododendri]|uniref:SDR family oxidoreductase n=1 Tax=Spirosoma rhododendri TaxID=2728024 RepID=A0A7L5DS01_9BACT|nr:SDR family oxidoreductase [Spirosoma rhododendri]QJD78420.1 SDR family oxidoreductase [Spirosoma rhododendri]